MTEPSADAANAPLVELRLAAAIRTYERLKLGLLLLVAILSVLLSVYGIGVVHAMKKTVDQSAQTLAILRCAVDRATSVDKHGQPRTADDAHRAFEACLAGGGPPSSTTRR